VNYCVPASCHDLLTLGIQQNTVDDHVVALF
jgi:hypothetical protein